jgi:hypothetical protein
MAMKMFNKSECEYKGGYIVCDGKIVCVDNKVVDLFNKLDIDIQRAKWEAEHQVEPVVQTEKFRPKTEHGEIFPVIEANTPELDKLAEHAIKVMDEVDAMEDAAKANEYFAGLHPVIMFVNDEFIVSGDQPTQHRFDLPTIGNPLELDKNGLADLVMSMFV